MNNKINLKPCPFCGSEAKIKHGFPKTQKKGLRQALVQCMKCGCRTITFKQFPYQSWKEVDELAINTWNRRQ